MKINFTARLLLGTSLVSLLAISACRKDQSSALPGDHSQTSGTVAWSPYMIKTIVKDLSGPQGLASDGMGNYYVASASLNQILRVSGTGAVSVFAGSGTGGYQDGPAVAARFNDPEGIAMDSQGNLFVADAGNSAIRRISPGGMVTTWAGGQNIGWQDGQGGSAKFNEPFGIAMDGLGNLFIADAGNMAIRRISPSGTVSTIAGGPGFTNQKSGNTLFTDPEGIAVDRDGNLYVTDAGNASVVKIGGTGQVTLLAGGNGAGFSDGLGPAARFYKPFGITVDSQGTLYIADAGNSAIRKVTPFGQVTTIAGGTELGNPDGPSTNLVNSPEGILIDGHSLVVSDGCLGTISQIGL